MKIRIRTVGEGEIFAYAERELRSFLMRYSNYSLCGKEDAEREIVLECGSGEEESGWTVCRIGGSEEESGWTVCRIGGSEEESGGTVCRIGGSEEESGWTVCRIEGREEAGRRIVTVSGGSQGGLLRGVYRMLERMGICFQMNGPVLNGLLDVTAWDGIEEEVRPFVRYRGIRQHINFPMDISSYHIEEAEEYIRNLARMGMNSITFHSYTGQWHGYETEHNTVYAGNYFYGQRHAVPVYPAVSEHVSNEKYYCIPEVEEKLSDVKARHEFSIRWLNRVMKVCRQVGMRITLSMELPEDEDAESLVKIVRGVLECYPLIDTIEWISPEGGGPGEKFACEELADKVREFFGEAPFAGGELPWMPHSLPESLPGAMESLKRAVELYGRREEIFAGLERKQIAVGLYVMCRETLRFLKNIMEAVLPEDVLFTFLPAHGSLAVAENISYMEFTEAQLQRTMIYSWMEFDGNMYLQQNGNRGIQELLQRTAQITGGAPIYGICLNHWRTAENEITAGYMARASVRFETASEFYGTYARKLGIGESAVFAGAMELLEEIDCFNRDTLFNIGFCYLGCWLGLPGLGWIRGWKRENLYRSIEMYREAIAKLECCLESTQTSAGIASVRLFINRMTCSILHIRCILALESICGITEDERPEAATGEQRVQIERQCREAMELAGEYLKLHMEQLPDRGCQGTAVSHYATIPVYIDHISQYFVQGEKICTHRPQTFDAPPPPDTGYLR